MSLPLKDHPVTKKEILGWALYDFANSSYTTVVISAVYGSFFIEKIASSSYSASWMIQYKNSLWSTAMIAATLLALFCSPLIGAIIDLSGQKKRWLLVLTLICAVCTAALATVNPGDVTMGILWVALGSACFMLTETLCASFLTDLATPQTMGWISGLGWGIGYLGGLCSLLVVRAVVTAGGPSANDIAPTQHAMVATALFFVISAIPTFVLVRNRSKPAPGFAGASVSTLMKAGLQRLRGTLHTGVLSHKPLRLFLCAFLLYMAGLDGVLKFVGIYAKEEVKFSLPDLTILFLLLQVSACLGALLFGLVERRWGAVRTVLVTLAWWVTAILGIYFLDDLSVLFDTKPRQIFFVLAVVAGAGVGSTQSASRTVVALLAPPEHTAEAFGFWGFFSRLATILGMSFGFAADVVGRRQGLLLLLLFFVAGAVTLLFAGPTPRTPCAATRDGPPLA